MQSILILLIKTTFVLTFSIFLTLIIIGAIINFASRKRKPNTPQLPDEAIIKKGGANLSKKKESVGGFLYLTNKRLIFESHSFNIQRGVTEINLNDVLKIEKGWTEFLGKLPLFPNALLIKTKNGSVYRFTVWNRSNWKSAIEKI